MKPAKKMLTQTFCKCIKKVRNYIKPIVKGQSKESAAIAVCINSVLKTRGKTLKKFSCRKGKLFTRSVKG